MNTSRKCPEERVQLFGRFRVQTISLYSQVYPAPPQPSPNPPRN
jgi:hypothetical protein